MATEAKMTEGSEFTYREIAAPRHDAVEHRTDVAVGEEKHVLAVAVHAEIGGVDLHLVEVKGCNNVSCAQRAARMPRLTPMHHADNVAAHLGGGSF